MRSAGCRHALDDGGRLVIKKGLTRIAIAAEEGRAIPACAVVVGKGPVRGKLTLKFIGGNGSLYEIVVVKIGEGGRCR